MLFYICYMLRDKQKTQMLKAISTYWQILFANLPNKRGDWNL